MWSSRVNNIYALFTIINKALAIFCRVVHGYHYVNIMSLKDVATSNRVNIRRKSKTLTLGQTFPLICSTEFRFWRKSPDVIYTVYIRVKSDTTESPIVLARSRLPVSFLHFYFLRCRKTPNIKKKTTNNNKSKTKYEADILCILTNKLGQ